MTAKKQKSKMFSFLRKKVGHVAACQIKKAMKKKNINPSFHFQDYNNGLCFYTRGEDQLVNCFYEGENLISGLYLRMEFSLHDGDKDKLLVSAWKHYEYDPLDDYEYFIFVEKKGE